jgi:thioredoxin reductase (NADPH)
MEQEGSIYDVLIIGGGPAGLSAAQYAARSGLKTLVLDKSATAGALAFTAKIENYPGITQAMSGRELLDIFRRQAVEFGAEYVEAQAVGVSLDGLVKEVFTVEGVYRAKTLIIATGAMGRRPTMKGEKEFLGRGVSYCAICDAAFYRDKTVCVIGDSAEAVKEAGLLRRFTEKVYLIAPSEKLGVEGDNPLIREKKINVLLNHGVTQIKGSEAVEAVVVLDKTENRETTMPMDGVFVYLHGSKPIVDFLNFAVEISDEECVLTNRMMESNIEGVFAAGDVACTEVRQVVIAAANGCVAALSAEKYLHHRKRHKYDWAKKD